LKPDSTHQRTLEQASQQSEDELRDRLGVEGYNDPNYLPSEVLVSFVKLQFGRASGLLDAIVARLNGRILALVRKFLKTRAGALRGGDKVEEDATNSVWVALAANDEPVGEAFAEVRFLPFVHRRLTDFVRQARRQQGDSVLFCQLDPKTVDGEDVAFEDTLAADAADQPESEVARNQLRERLTRLLTTEMPKKEKLAVYFRIELGYDWKKAAELMDCSVPTARKYYALGVQRLLGELDDGPENDR
jgi:DNA-directed RNA polymerase specialized sigma24 family protein